MKDIEHIGGWQIHKKGIFKNDLSIEKECDGCGNIYSIKEDRNHLAEEQNIFLNSRTIKETGFSTDLMGDTYEKVIQHKGICPYCNYSEELFCEPKGETFENEREFVHNF